jgi:ketosteroid isomerase-like protein
VVREFFTFALVLPALAASHFSACLVYPYRTDPPVQRFQWRKQMSTQENIALVRRFYDAYMKGQKDLLLSYMADDIDWDIPEMDGLAFSGRRLGREEVARFFGMVAQVQALRSFEPQEFFGDGDRVVVLGHHEWTVKSNGAPFGSDWVHVFTIRNGQIAAFRQSMDTLRVVQAHRS